MLRDYQQRALDKIIAYLKKSRESCMLEAATGAGKSHVIAALAAWLTLKTDKRVLCLAPSKELVEQNHEKYLATGNPAAIFCASIEKRVNESVIFGSPKSVKNALEKFAGDYCAVIVDECHNTTPTIKTIIDTIRTVNPNLRVIGMTATPYRLNEGYIYRINEKGAVMAAEESKCPYYHKLIDKITAHELIQLGFLTPPTTEHTHLEYDTSKLEKSNLGTFTTETVRRAFLGKTRKTTKIVEDIIAKAWDRKGVMIFCSTVDHAREALAMLPVYQSALVTGDTKKRDRERIIKSFKKRAIKYIINVQTLTTGFDAPHVDCIAVLRATESPGLLQQIIGRGLRIAEGKADVLVLDYAGNIARHKLEDDIFDPEISALPESKLSFIQVDCPACYQKNRFKARHNESKLDISDDGYFVDQAGNKLDIPAHHGRTCAGCSYRWTFKNCPSCNAENDIAARRCESCNFEIIDPNKKLLLEHTKLKKDPYAKTTDKVRAWSPKLWTSKTGNTTLRIDYKTDYRTFSVWYQPAHKDLWADLCQAVFGKVVDSPYEFMKRVMWDNGGIKVANDSLKPKTITVKRKKDTRYYTVTAHNRAEETPDTPEETDKTDRAQSNARANVYPNIKSNLS